MYIFLHALHAFCRSKLNPCCAGFDILFLAMCCVIVLVTFFGHCFQASRLLLFPSNNCAIPALGLCGYSFI